MFKRIGKILIIPAIAIASMGALGITNVAHVHADTVTTAAMSTKGTPGTLTNPCSNTQISGYYNGSHFVSLDGRTISDSSSSFTVTVNADGSTTYVQSTSSTIVVKGYGMVFDFFNGITFTLFPDGSWTTVLSPNNMSTCR